MPVFEETWDIEDYKVRGQLNLTDVPENALRVVNNLSFRFSDYKANQQVACWAYERGLFECRNHYGIFGAYRQPECLQLESFLDQCVARHNAIDLMKTYNPELFVRHRLSRPVPNPKELGLK